MSCDAWRQDLVSCNVDVGAPCYENNILSHVYNCILYFIQYYVLHCIDPALKINVSKLFVFDVFICC